MVPLTIALPPADVLDTEPRLAAPLAIERKIEPLPDLLREIGRAAGTALTVGSDLKGVKATVLTGSRPLRETLRALAVTFDAEWERTKAGELRLAPTPEAFNRRATFLRALLRTRRAQTERTLERWALAATIPWGDRDAELKVAARTVAERPDDSKAEIRRAEEWHAALKATDEPTKWAYGKLWGRLPTASRTAFWSGVLVRGSTRARGGVPKLPVEAEGWTRGYKRDDEADQALRVFLRYDPQTGRLEERFDSLGGSGSGSGVGPVDTEILRDHPFLAAQREWIRHKSDIALGDPGPIARPDWFGYFGSDSDALAILHRQSGMPIVAEAFRRPHSGALAAFSQTTLGAALRDGGFGYVRVENGTVHVRPEEFWTERTIEPPEAPLRALEATPEPSIDQYAACAAATSGRSISFTPQGPTLTRVDPHPLLFAEPGLRVWGLLDARQREAALAGTPIRLEAMRPVARDAAWRAIEDGLFAQGKLSDELLARFDGPFDLANAGGLALFVDTRGKRSSRLRLFKPGLPLDGTGSPHVNTGPLTGLVFGTGVDEGVGFYVRPRGMPRPE